VKLKTGDHREGIKGQKEGKENCRDPGREGKENVGVRSSVGWLPNLVS
jgi:hypothetical protein